jgi:hypothetical protein
MAAVAMLVRSTLRRRTRALAVITLLTALAGGVSIAAFAGARRTSSSFRRFVVAGRAQDVLILDDDVATDAVLVRRMPDVRAVGRARFVALTAANGELLDV